MTLDEVRKAYALDIGRRGQVVSSRLLEALAQVPRERFVGPGPWVFMDSGLGTAAKPQETPSGDPIHVYRDISIALDPTRSLYNGAPSTLVSWIDALGLREGDEVFHIGAGTGYYTAVIAEVVGPRGRVLAAEIDETLGVQARTNLSDYRHVEVVITDGASYDPGGCDAILVNAGVTHPSKFWTDRLKLEGRLVLPLTFEFPNTHLGKGALLRIRKEQDGFSAAFMPQPVVIFSCTNNRDAALNAELFAAFTARAALMREVRSLRLDLHDAEPTCWVHAGLICLSCNPVRSAKEDGGR